MEEKNIKQRMTVYLSGPVAGFDATERGLFYRAAEMLIERKLSHQYDVDFINPLTFQEGDMSWTDFLKECVRQLPDADVMCRLPGADTASNCILEDVIARELSIPVMEYLELYKEADQ